MTSPKNAALVVGALNEAFFENEDYDAGVQMISELFMRTHRVEPT